MSEYLIDEQKAERARNAWATVEGNLGKLIEQHDGDAGQAVNYILNQTQHYNIDDTQKELKLKRKFEKDPTDNNALALARVISGMKDCGLICPKMYANHYLAI